MILSNGNSLDVSWKCLTLCPKRRKQSSENKKNEELLTSIEYPRISLRKIQRSTGVTNLDPFNLKGLFQFKFFGSVKL